jgi:hypothetical protein
MMNKFEFQSLFENVPGPGTKRVAVIIGRFNPPTKGHYELIQKVREFVRANKLQLDAIPVVIVIGNDKKKKTADELLRNPLTVHERITFMQGSGHANGVKFISATNAFEALTKVRQQGMEPIAIAAGSDRIQDYINILNKYFKDANDKPIKHVPISLERDASAVETKSAVKADNIDDTLEAIRGGEAIETDIVSGSLARRAAELGYFEEFAKIVGLERNQKLAKMLFDKIKKTIDGAKGDPDEVKEAFNPNELSGARIITLLAYFLEKANQRLVEFFKQYPDVRVKFKDEDRMFSFYALDNDKFWFTGSMYPFDSQGHIGISIMPEGSRAETPEDFFSGLMDDDVASDRLKNKKKKVDLNEVFIDLANIFGGDKNSAHGNTIPFVDGFHPARWEFHGAGNYYPYLNGELVPSKEILVKILGE